MSAILTRQTGHFRGSNNGLPVMRSVDDVGETKVHDSAVQQGQPLGQLPAKKLCVRDGELGFHLREPA